MPRRARTRPPCHPGRILTGLYLKPLNLSVPRLAQTLGVQREVVSDIVGERKPVTPEMATGLARVFNMTPECWLNLQRNYDLWRGSRKEGN